ncbi:MAG: TolC family protein [Deltaproteobacteria bacterium]|nr:TolC family protein [Deltaproteobacteria bacterium]
MTLRLTLALTLLAVVPAVRPVLAQPRTEQPPAVGDEMAEFEKELDALFSSGGLTADEAAQRASRVSPSVRRSAAQIEVAIAQAQAAELSRVPQVGGSLSYTRLSPIDTPVFGDPASGMAFEFPVILNQYAASARASINLSDYVLRYPKLISAARLAEEVARTSNRSAMVNAGQEARVAYYEWVRARLQNLIAKRQLEQVRTTLRQVRALAEAQRLSRADLMRVESNEAVAEQASIQLRNLAELREEQVRLLIDAPPEQPLTIGEDIRVDITAAVAGKLDDLLGTAKKQRLDFKVLDTGIEAKERQRAAERANLYPKLSAFGQVDYANPNQRIFPAEEKFNLTWAVGAQISWTLNETLFARTTDRRLRGETNELRADRENLERGTRIELLAAQQSVSIAIAALATSAKGLAAAQEGYRVRRELLNAQRATAVELVDAETDLTRARIAALNARVDLRVAMVQLAHALGNDVK